MKNAVDVLTDQNKYNLNTQNLSFAIDPVSQEYDLSKYANQT